MRVLNDAVFARYNAIPAGNDLRAATSAMFPQDAVLNTTGIYLTYQAITIPHSWLMGPSPKTIREALYQINAWEQSDSPDGVADVGELIIDLYDDALLTVAGFATIRADVINEGPIPDPVNKGFQYFVEVRYRLEE